MKSGGSRRERLGRFGEEFFAPLPLLSVALFALNNFFWKEAFPGYLTGKLSDVTACFFLPVFVSALLDVTAGRRLRLRARVSAGALLTALVFASVKLDERASRCLDDFVNAAGAYLGLPESVNHVDRSDLLALPFIALSVLYALRTAPARSSSGRAHVPAGGAAEQSS